MFNGTAANVLCLEALTRPWEAVVCTPTAHIHVDECGAPERAGRKLLLAGGARGKLTPADVEPLLARVGDEHAVQPRVISIAESTELGTVYSLEEIAALADFAHAHGMLLHLDGARLANAAAALGVPLAALTTEAGVDALSLGATKNGALGAEAVVLLSPDAGGEFKFLRKQAMQLASKMRFLSAQLLALYDGELWRENAAHANAMAARLHAALDGVVEFTQPVEANGALRRAAAGRHDRAPGRLALLRLGRGDAARCAGCAPGTRRRTTSTASPPPSAPRWPRSPARTCRRSRAAGRASSRRRPFRG